MEATIAVWNMKRMHTTNPSKTRTSIASGKLKMALGSKTLEIQMRSDDTRAKMYKEMFLTLSQDDLEAIIQFAFEEKLLTTKVCKGNPIKPN